jgi:hypothetical protein
MSPSQLVWTSANAPEGCPLWGGAAQFVPLILRGIKRTALGIGRPPGPIHRQGWSGKQSWGLQSRRSGREPGIGKQFLARLRHFAISCLLASGAFACTDAPLAPRSLAGRTYVLRRVDGYALPVTYEPEGAFHSLTFRLVSDSLTFAAESVSVYTYWQLVPASYRTPEPAPNVTIDQYGYAISGTTLTLFSPVTGEEVQGAVTVGSVSGGELWLDRPLPGHDPSSPLSGFYTER